MTDPPIHCPACSTDFTTVADFRSHLAGCRANDPPPPTKAEIAALRDPRSRLLADVFQAEAKRYEGQGQSTEAWLMRWASDVCLEDFDRLVQRKREEW